MSCHVVWDQNEEIIWGHPVCHGWQSKEWQHLEQTSSSHNSSVAPDCSQIHCKNTQYQMNVKSETSGDLRKAYQPENGYKRYIIG